MPLTSEVTKTSYIRDGVHYRRVTTILEDWIEPWLVEWRLELGRVEAGKKSRAALKIGSRVDELVMKDVMGQGYKLRKDDSKEVISCMAGWDSFKDRHSPKAVSVQVTSYDDLYGTAGTYDIELEDCLIDVKTGQQISPKYWLQVAWYNFISGLNKPYIAILRLDPFWKTFEYKVKPMKNGYLEVFKGIMAAQQYLAHQGEIE